MTPAAAWAADTVLGAGVAEYDGRLVLRLRYRADVLDSDSAARIFGYYRTALELITADPGARHGGRACCPRRKSSTRSKGSPARAGCCRNGGSTKYLRKK